MKSGFVRDKAGTVGHHAKLTKIRNGARWVFCIDDNGISFFNKALLIAVNTLPKVEHS